ncbi:MAG: hypothetical protein NZL83_04145 [Candidatus Absconditabacterales bacterium]|nr:hypothetical protein [Candidatus Absconditabacterales bacterium]
MVLCHGVTVWLVLGDDKRLARFGGECREADDQWHVLGRLVSSHTIDWMVGMVFRWYTSFVSLFSLFHYPSSVDDIVGLIDDKKTKKLSSLHRLPKSLQSCNHITDFEGKPFVCSEYSGQQLLLFPNQWIMYSVMGDLVHHPACVVLTPSLSESTQGTVYKELCAGKKSIILTTGAGLFRDWWWVRHIVVYYPRNEYYVRRRSPWIDPVHEALLCASWGWTVDCVM